jgi:hypothetical protein
MRTVSTRPFTSAFCIRAKPTKAGNADGAWLIDSRLSRSFGQPIDGHNARDRNPLHGAVVLGLVSACRAQKE